MDTYGKSLGGGLPIGVVCGRAELMQRFSEAHPADVCFARGTFNSHPYVMGAMHEFLQRLESEPIQALYRGLDRTWDERARGLNERLRAAQLPVHVTNLSTIWTLNYLQPSRYNWMFQYYLRAEGLALSWVGTARLIFSLNYGEADFASVADRIVSAAEAMRRDGWWWPGSDLTNRAIRRTILRELLQAWWTTSSIGSRSSPRSRYSGARQ
jgi:glutamate-1-semialdehyde 2,1-aminomutase